ncbi:hypothetical protein HJC23_002920 [Cyclotella cryptica]|uniref:Uncharacterized protein n=1 Tax=Cyclotella cryptica TaxID=29204 RepID=A0ABD3PRF6_9STRA
MNSLPVAAAMIQCARKSSAVDTRSAAIDPPPTETLEGIHQRKRSLDENNNYFMVYLARKVGIISTLEILKHIIPRIQ